MFDNYSLALNYLNNAVFYFVLIAIILMVVAILLYRRWYKSKQVLLTPEEQQQLIRRQRVAEYLADEVVHLNRQERWQDNRFTELEAEAEVEAGGAYNQPFLYIFTRSHEGLRHEKSLSDALRKTLEKNILLIGEPGAGKSIALRHLAFHVAHETAKCNDLTAPIPIYLNLKELERHQVEQQRQVQQELDRIELFELLEKRLSENELKTLYFCLNLDVEDFPADVKSSLARELVLVCDRQERLPELVSTCRKRHPNLFRGGKLPTESQAIDRHLIRKFVIDKLEYGGNRDMDEFLEEDFEREFRRGHLLFLFDSFDELPEVLSSTEEDSTISDYTKAIEGFLREGKCRGIVASRAYRGPLQSTWPKFRILPLSEERRITLIEKANLKPQLANELKGQLRLATGGLHEMIKNPMFLGLLCEYMKSGEVFPQKAHDVFESYIQSRFKRDEARLQRRYAEVSLTDLRQFAENVAFCMTADYELGLNPTRYEIKAAMTRLGFEVDSHFELLLDALEYIRLARSQTSSSSAEAANFTFAHRRFQEYFATCVVLREPERINPEQLLTNGRWRETAVTLCQSQSPAQLTPLINEGRHLLTEIVTSLPDLLTDPVAYVQNPTEYAKQHGLKPLSDYFFEWPAQSLHILGLLQSGFWGRMDYVLDDIRLLAARLIVSAGRGSLLDQVDGLEVAGIVPEPVLVWLLQQAFMSNSMWLHDMAYQQAARLPHMTDEIAQGIRLSLIQLAQENTLPREKYTIMAHLSRLDRAEDFKSTAELLLWIPRVHFILHLLMVVITIITVILSNYNSTSFYIRFIIILPLFILISYKYLTWGNITTLFGLFTRSNEVNFIGLSSLVWMEYLAVIAILLLFITLNWLSIVPVMFYSIWLFSVDLTTYNGLRIQKFLWPILPVGVLVHYIIKLFQMTFRQFIRMLISRTTWFIYFLIRLLFQLIALGLFFIVFVIFGSFGDLFLRTSPYADQIISYVLSFVFLFVSLAGTIILIIPMALKGLIRWPKEEMRYWRWQKKNHGMMTTQSFLDLISSYEFDRSRLKIIQVVYKQSLLMTDNESEITLKNLLVTLEKEDRKYKRSKVLIFTEKLGLTWFIFEKESRDKDAKLLEELASLEKIELPDSHDFTEWYQHYTQKDKHRLGKWNSQQYIDELSKLLKQVRANRAE